MTPPGTVLVARTATVADAPLLAEMNHQLIRDEGHRNPMTQPERAARMRAWLAGGYAAILFERNGAPVAYALYREAEDGIYLRQFFVARPERRGGVGRQAMRMLLDEIWPPARRVYVEVLAGNTTGAAFWKAFGFREYAITLELDRPATATG